MPNILAKSCTYNLMNFELNFHCFSSSLNISLMVTNWRRESPVVDYWRFIGNDKIGDAETDS